jgi:hypothetical protein
MSPEEMAKAMGDDAPTCSLNDGHASNTTSATSPEENTSCPLPIESPPPPPPPESSIIYHLCQKSNWDTAVNANQPYFPPTFLADGKFTRASLRKDDLISTANTFYKDVQGDWIVLEIDCQLLYSLGIIILVKEAPESTQTQPVSCLQVFGGISTSLSGLIIQICDMERSPVTGTFLSIRINLMDYKHACGKPLRSKEQAKPSQKGKFRLFQRKTKGT